MDLIKTKNSNLYKSLDEKSAVCTQGRCTVAADIKVFIMGLSLGFLTAQNRQLKRSDINVIQPKLVENRLTFFVLRSLNTLLYACLSMTKISSINSGL